MWSNNPTAAFIEELAVSLELFGWPRMAGRIIAHLLICSADRQTQKDIAAAISASKASVSTMLSLLLESGIIVKTSFPGDRRDYYRLVDNVSLSLAQRQLALHKRLFAVATRGELSLNLGEINGSRLRQFAQCQLRLVAEVEKGLEGWACDRP